MSPRRSTMTIKYICNQENDGDPRFRRRLLCFAFAVSVLWIFTRLIARLQQPQRRVAYVLSLNTTAERYGQTHDLLRRFGFDIEVVRPHFFGTSRNEKTLSNKVALLTALERIHLGSKPWGYIFEDDITQHELSKESLKNLIVHERTSPLFQYLGVCTPKNKTPERLMCGRCAHAMGFSKQGAEEFLRFSRQSESINILDLYDHKSDIIPRQEVYFDKLIEAWCLQKGGFPVLGPLRKSREGDEGHFGTFIQDRTKFESYIDLEGV